MATISLSLPSDGQTIDAADVNTPLNTISAVINGNLDDDNVKVGANINGTKLLINSIPPTAGDANMRGGWNAGIVTAMPTVTALGNRSYSLVHATTDLTSYLSPGMRLKLTRTVTAPTQCTSLNGTTQYYSKTSPAGMAQTDSITESIWCKPSAYQTGGLISRNNGTTDGWLFYLNASGQVVLAGARAADDLVTSYQSVPLNKWVHISASINTTTTTGIIEIDGASVPVSYTNNANTGFAAPTQSYLIGATNGASPTNFFAGKIAQAASWNAVVSVATQLTYLSQGLAGTETSLISAYSFNNSINDLNANANNLTANGSAVATNADSPFGGQADGTISSTLDYAIITKTAFSTNTTLTVQVPEGCAIPTSGGVSAVSYSSVKAPYGFPAQRGKWIIWTLNTSDQTQVSPVSGTWYNFFNLTIPIGEWMVGYQGTFNVTNGTNVGNIYATLSTGASTESDITLTNRMVTTTASGNSFDGVMSKSKDISLSSATPYYLNIKTVTVAASSIKILGASGATLFTAELAYL